MAWIESHQTLRDHPKLSKLASILKMPKPQAIGHLHMLWWWCIDYADDGLLDRYTEAQVCEAAGFQGDLSEISPRIIQALINAEFLDSEPLRVHDWLDFCGDLVKKRLEYRKAKRRRTKRLGNSLRKTENSQRTVTVPDRNRTSHINTTPPQVFSFADIYDIYPNRDSRKESERHFLATVKSEKDYADIQKALANYIRHLKDEAWKKPKSAKTWFNNWRDWITYTGVTMPKEPKAFRKPEIHPPDPTAAEIKEMHDAKVLALGVCRVKDCAFCGTEKK